MAILSASVALLMGSAAPASAMPAMAMPGMPMPSAAERPSSPQPATTLDGGPALQPTSPDAPAVADMSGMDMAGMAMGHMAGALAAYPMTRDASGTSWQPDSAPMEGLHGRTGDWSTMVHGYAAAVYDDQGGPRGSDKAFVESMLMGMAQRPVGEGTLTLRGMVSADPLMGKSGYPLLLQTGESANGRTPLVDRQHPHDLFMELAVAYSRPIAGGLSGFLYAGLPGEPALGPATYMHRFSGMASPEAPLGHHWLDSTHVTFGVVTAGLVFGGVKLEASGFTGREPDQHRYDLERPRMDSWSLRATWNPGPDWSLQVSHGNLKSPEQLEPDVDQSRTTASATYNRPLAWRGARGDWQTTVAWGRDQNRPGRTTDAYLLESAVSLGSDAVFGRMERVGKDELFADDPANPLRDRLFTVAKLSVGYYRTVPLERGLALDFGGLFSRYALPSALDPAYGADPTSFMLFARVKLR